MSAAPDAGDVAWQMLAGVRCQAIHQQLAGAWCPNCESWARTVGEPFWRPSLDAATAERIAKVMLRARWYDERDAVFAARLARGEG